jgi:hypothetical protein
MFHRSLMATLSATNRETMNNALQRENRKRSYMILRQNSSTALKTGVQRSKIKIRSDPWQQGKSKLIYWSS